jgi:hypothetical protein
MNHRTISLACLIFLSTTSARAQTLAKPISVKTLIDSIDHALNNNYIFPAKSKLMADKLKSQYKKGAYGSLKDPFQIKHAIENDLKSVHQDGHLHLNYDPVWAERLKAPRHLKSTRDDSIALQQGKADNFYFNRVEILNGNIGYVQFRGFHGFVKEAKSTISAAFRFVKNTDAVIIDLRTNGGGSPRMVKQIASYFVKERTHLNDIYERKRNETEEFWADPKDADSVSLLMPIYVLTSKSTFSAAEDFTYAMQVNKRAVIVGDTTGGGAHPTDVFAIGQGYVMSVPVARSINPITKTDWEGTGILPDVPVRAEEALVKAQELILLNKLSSLSSDQEKEQVQLKIFALRPIVTLTPDQWKSLNGRYELDGNNKFHLQISSKQDKLILKQEWDGAEVAFEAKSELEFFCRDLLFPLKFTKNAQGESTQVLAFGHDLWLRMKEK